MEDRALRYRPDELLAFATTLLQRAGLDTEMAADVAAVLVESDLLGYSTHGLRQLAPCLADLGAGRMARHGTPRVFNARAAAALWDGQRLPGPWLVRRAIGWAAPRAVQYGCASVVIRGGRLLGCLAAYLEPVARTGLLIQVVRCGPDGVDGALADDAQPTSVQPAEAGSAKPPQVGARAAGTQPASEPNRIAVGIPASDDPILIGVPAFAIVRDDCMQALLFGALTAALAGHDPDDPDGGRGATVSVQIHDPAAFGGLEGFRREVDRIAATHRAGAPADAPRALPASDEPGLARKRGQLALGVRLHPDILEGLAPWAAGLGVSLPAALA